MGVSENRGTPKSSILIGISIINHPFWGIPNFWKHPHVYWIPSTKRWSTCLHKLSFTQGSGKPTLVHCNVTRVSGFHKTHISFSISSRVMKHLFKQKPPFFTSEKNGKIHNNKWDCLSSVSLIAGVQNSSAVYWEVSILCGNSVHRLQHLLRVVSWTDTLVLLDSISWLISYRKNDIPQWSNRNHWATI